MRNERGWLGIAHVLGFVVASLVWIAILGVGLALVAMGRPALFADVSLADLSHPPTPELTGILTVFTIVHLAGMAAIAVVGALILPATGGDRLRTNLALASPAGWTLPIALATGLTTGLFPAWVAERLADRVPEPLVDSFVNEALTGTAGTRLAIAIAVTVAAPLCEELVFRGYLWAAIERYGSAVLALVVTSLLFAAYHVDPAQVLGVLPIGFVLAWTRYWTGSVWPAVVVHAANNGLALLVAASTHAATPTPAWLAFGGLALTLAGCATLTRAGGRHTAM